MDYGGSAMTTPVKETVVRTNLAALHAIEDAGERPLIMWMLAGPFAAHDFVLDSGHVDAHIATSAARSTVPMIASLPAPALYPALESPRPRQRIEAMFSGY